MKWYCGIYIIPDMNRYKDEEYDMEGEALTKGLPAGATIYRWLNTAIKTECIVNHSRNSVFVLFLFLITKKNRKTKQKKKQTPVFESLF